MNEMLSRLAESWKFTATNTAVVVVDMQNIWVHPRRSSSADLGKYCSEDPRTAAILS